MERFHSLLPQSPTTLQDCGVCSTGDSLYVAGNVNEYSSDNLRCSHE